VRISKKNICICTINKGDTDLGINDHGKLLMYFLQQQNPSWKQQIENSVMLGPTIDEDNLVADDVSLEEALTHFASITWKVLFSSVPPASYWGGYPCFVISLCYIGLVTAVVGEIATAFGCVMGISELTTANTIVALGTSLPDTFASMTAAKTSESADSAIGNVTGSNSVNVFLGLGLPWVIACTYKGNKMPMQIHEVPSKGLGFTVGVFLVVAVVCFMILVARRIFIGGELGGPTVSKYVSATICISLWFIYIIASIVQ